MNCFLIKSLKTNNLFSNFFQIMEFEKQKITLNFENEKKRTFSYCTEVANLNEFKDIFNNLVLKVISKELNILDENHESI